MARLWANSAFRLAVRAVLTVLALAIVIRVVSIRSLLNNLRSVEVAPLVAALLVTIPLIGVRIWKWGLVAHYGGLRLSPRHVTTSFLAGMWLGLIVPGRIGELGRALYVGEGRRSQGLGLVTLDRIYDLAVTVLGAGLAYWAVFGGTQGGLVTVAAVVTCIFVVLLPFLGPGGERLLGTLPLKRLTIPAFRAATSLRGWAIFWCLLLGAISLLLGGLQFHLVMLGLHPIPLVASLLAFPVSLIAGVISPTISGTGGRELTTAVLLVALTHAQDIGASGAVATFVCFIFNSVLPAVAGSFCLGAPKTKR